MKRFVLAALIGVATLSFAREAHGDDLAYGLFGDELKVIDLTTGVQTDVGHAGPFYSGLGVGPDGSLYGTTQGSGGLLFRIDTTGNGNNIPFDSSPLGASLGFGSTANGSLYGLDSPDGLHFSLYSIDPATGFSTVVGATGLSFPFGGISQPGVDKGSGVFDLHSGFCYPASSCQDACATPPAASFITSSTAPSAAIPSSIATPITKPSNASLSEPINFSPSASSAIA